MPAIDVPRYRQHKSTRRAYVTLNGRQIYLGPYGTPESRQRYDRLIAEWIAAGRQLVPRGGDVAIVELVARFWEHAKAFYRRADGTPTDEDDNYRQALRPLVALYGDTPAGRFGPLALRAVQAQMIRMGWCRSNINRQINRVRHFFKWAASEEAISGEIYHALQTVAPLKRGRCEAAESDPVTPVDLAHVEAVLPYLSAQIVAMIRLQILAGMRGGEAVIMRGCNIDTSADVWTYTPSDHKTAHFGHAHPVYLGPRAQEILSPFLKADSSAFLFSPVEAEADRRTQAHAARATPLSCGNRPGTNRRRRPDVRPGDRYTTDSYRRAIARACDQADVPRWSPHQLRHTAGTAIRRDFGLEAAQVILGHKTLTMTQVYAERNVAAARAVMLKVG